MTFTPVFVYGTLRTGEYNYFSRIEPFPHVMVPATIKGFEMWAGGGYPYIFPSDDPERVVRGELVYLDSDEKMLYDYFMAGMDALEGYRGPGKSNHYDRLTVEATTDEGEKVNAFVYVGGAQHRPRVEVNAKFREDGDWIAYVMENSSRR